MTEQELDQILRRKEGTRTEFKQSRDNMPGSLFETITSFLNKEGGVILLGVQDDGSVSGINPFRIGQIKKDIVTTSNDPNALDPPFLVSPKEMVKDGQQILSIRIPVSSQVHKHAGIIYDRENDSDLTITDQDRIGEIYFRKRNHFTESSIYPFLKISDFSEELFGRVRMLLRSRRVDHPWLEEDNQGLMRLAGLYRRDFQSGEEGFTLAAALIFGADTVIQSILPAYKVEAMLRVNNTDRYDDRISLRTNLLDTYSRLMEFIRMHLPDKFYLDGEQRKDLRELIFREIIANVIVHREYTNAEATNFIVHEDRIEASNPNTVRFRGYLHPDSFQPYPKNPLISKLFTELGWVEEIGSGIKNINKYLPIYADGNNPTFIEEDTFRTIIPLKRYKLEDKTTQVLAFLNIEEDTLPAVIKARLRELTIDKDLFLQTEIDGFLYHMVSSWIKEGTKLERLRILTVKKAPSSEKWKALSMIEKGTKLYGKRMTILIKVLIRLLAKTSMDDLMTYMEYRNRKSFIDTYMKPLMEYDLIQRTYPSSPRHPNQKYIITEKGSRFLGGFEL